MDEEIEAFALKETTVKAKVDTYMMHLDVDNGARDLVDVDLLVR